MCVCVCVCALQVADLSAADASEEDKLMAMMSQSGVGFDPSQYVTLRTFIHTCSCTAPKGGGGAACVHSN